jgi:hypothetical protein
VQNAATTNPSPSITSTAYVLTARYDTGRTAKNVGVSDQERRGLDQFTPKLLKLENRRAKNAALKNRLQGFMPTAVLKTELKNTGQRVLSAC